MCFCGMFRVRMSTIQTGDKVNNRQLASFDDEAAMVEDDAECTACGVSAEQFGRERPCSLWVDRVH
jgi:hypothetical protein